MRYCISYILKINGLKLLVWSFLLCWPARSPDLPPPPPQLTFDGRRATLTIPEPFPKDAGTYSITASNAAGRATCSCTVSVKVSPRGGPGVTGEGEG